MDNIVINKVEVHKHLGLSFTSNGLWKEHIWSISQKAWKRLSTLRPLKFKLDKKSLEQLYFSYIRPIIEYADVVWDNCSKNDKLLLDKIQNEAMRIVSGATKSVSISNLYKELGWDTLGQRREKHRLIQYFKMFHTQTPQYLSNLIPQPVMNRSTYDLRNNTNLDIPLVNSDLYKNSFVPATTHLWNGIPQDIRLCPSISNFKRYLNRSKICIPSYYFIGDRQQQVNHARIRMGCSNLKYDLHKNFLSNSPLCSCGEVEDPKHFFLNCHKYVDERNSNLLTLPYHLDIETILFGNRLFTEKINSEIFLHVQNFMKETKRFS